MLDETLRKFTVGLWTSGMRRQPFSDRGLSRRTIDALLDASIDAPERLLFMSEQQIKGIPGIGKASVTEIASYRAKYIR
jgi:DNA-directed RNA polymerase alpha subunit